MTTKLSACGAQHTDAPLLFYNLGPSLGEPGLQLTYFCINYPIPAQRSITGLGRSSPWQSTTPSVSKPCQHASSADVSWPPGFTFAIAADEDDFNICVIQMPSTQQTNGGRQLTNHHNTIAQDLPPFLGNGFCNCHDCFHVIPGSESLHCTGEALITDSSSHCEE
ncbi:hypothetical protein ACKLNR_000833 [Fusarium oxysporum f. sp. zingiberi]